MKNRVFQIACFCLVSVLLSCQGTKVLQDDQRLYNGATLNFVDNRNLEDNRNTTAELQELLQPEPNTTLLGMRPPLWVYYITRNARKEKGLKNWLRDKFGEEPVLVEDVNAGNTRQLLQKKLLNEGYFSNEVNFDWTLNKKTGMVQYDILLNKAYHFDSITYPDSVNTITGLINGAKANALVKPNHRYQLQRLMDERRRIKGLLRNKGYYYFDESNLIFETDTTVGNQKIESSLQLKDKIPSRSKEQFKIGKITIKPVFDANITDTLGNDTLMYDEIHFRNLNNEYRPGILADNINLRPGDLYSFAEHDQTINKLMGLNVFRYVNSNYKTTDKAGVLNAEYKLFPYKKKSIRMELQAISKSTNFIGPHFSTTFQNRNFLKGAEMFQLSLNAGFETRLGNNEQFSYEAGFESSLTMPKFISPFNVQNRSSRFVPNTIIKTGMQYKNRTQFFSLRSINLGYGYKWNETLYKNHEFFPIKINLVDLISTTQKFDDELESNPLLRQSYEEQFVLGGGYSYIYNTQAVDNKRSNTDFYFRVNTDLSGNSAYLIQNLFGTKNDNKEDHLEILGARYAQFAKVDFDVRFYYQIDKNNRLATRLITGVGAAYGNSETLPYVNQFSIGGSSSLRAFPARSLGPGTYPGPYTDDSLSRNQFIDQTGDIKIEWNLEHRFNIIGSLKGAVFVDVGNIWTLKRDSSRTGSDFQWESFLDQMAVGTGLGLRYDANFFVIRLDGAIPARVPANPDNPGDLWILDDVFKRNDPWKGQEFIFNIAIGYPF